MKKYLFALIIIGSFSAFAQTNTTVNKSIVVGETAVSYMYKAKINPEFKQQILETITHKFGKSRQDKSDLVWNRNGSYEIVLANDEVRIHFGKSSDNQSIYTDIKALGNDLTEIINKPHYKNRAISTKSYVLNDRANSYSFRGVFTQNKRNLIKKSIENQFGEANSKKDNLVWNKNSKYNIDLKNGEVEISLEKSSDNEIDYKKITELEQELISILINYGPKNIAISNKTYVLNDNAIIYSFRGVFHERKKETIKKIIEAKFGNAKTNNQNELIWYESGVFEINLTAGILKISYDKSNENEEVYNQLKTVVEEILAVINK